MPVGGKFPVRAHINSRRLVRLATVAAIAAGVVVVSSSAAHAVVSDAGPTVVHEVNLPSPVGGDVVTPDDWSWA